jgi:hypothetical protein
MIYLDMEHEYMENMYMIYLGHDPESVVFPISMLVC